MWRFTPFFMWGSDNSNFLNSRMVIEDTFYLNRRNILPATNDDIFFTVVNYELFTINDLPHIVGELPAVHICSSCFLFIFSINFHENYNFDKELTHIQS